MTEQNMFLALPNDLFAEATEIARMQGITLSDLLVEALSESVEGYQARGWIAERAQPYVQRTLVVRSSRQVRSGSN